MNETTRTPEPPYPKQHLPKPGLEKDLEPRPRYLAPDYIGSKKLDGKVALITGGDSGIGRSVAVLFAREGANVAIVHLPEEEPDARETRQAVEAEGRSCHAITADLKHHEECERVVKEAVDTFGRIDILVNNAAFQQHQGGLDQVSHEQWDTTFKTNIYAYFNMAKAALPHLEEGSAIINSGSIVGLKGSGGLLDYSATKGAIHAFTKSLAQNLAPRGIRVNCVAPGPVWTPLNPADRDAEEIQAFGKKQPYGRPAQPEEIAPSYVFFAADACSRYVTGEVLALLGGATRTS